MPFLTVKSGYLKSRTEYQPGLSIKDILDATETRVRSGCRGLGACGLCKIRIESGNPDLPGKIEMLQLEDEELEDHIRLACQVKPTEDMMITVISPAEKFEWKTVYEQEYCTAYPLSSYQQVVRKAPFKLLGAVVDLGTTNISVALFDLESGKQLSRKFGPNPQARFGADIISRLTAACQSPDDLKSMQNETIKSIGKGLADMSVQEGIAPEHIMSLSLVGNTAMLAILSGRNYKMLLNPKYWMQYVDCLTEKTSGWIEAWRLHPEAKIRIVRPLAGFVGSDLVAGIVTTDLLVQESPALLIDIGTNSEIALWDGDRLFVTSAAGGPAFEGAGISNGMPAAAGAVYCATPNNQGKWTVKTVANQSPRGICGSGVVDIVSILLENGTLTQAGKLPEKKLTLPIHDGDHLFVTNNDIDLFQRAKAAISVGVIVLCREAGVDIRKLGRICIGGAFGQYLDVENAQATGLLPPIAPEKITLSGNTALTGGADILLSREAAKFAGRIIQNASIVNLSVHTDFENLFFENLWLRPIKNF